MTLTLDELNQAFLRLLTPAPALGTACETPDPASDAGTLVPAAPAPTPAAAPVPPCRIVEAKAKGYHFEAEVAPDQIVPAGRLLDERGFAIDAVTGVDWLAKGQMEIVYDFYHPLSVVHVVVRCRVPRDGAEVPTLSEVFPGANWHERETHDFFGIRFTGHPDLSPFLLPEDADYHPLRKDFTGAA